MPSNVHAVCQPCHFHGQPEKMTNFQILVSLAGVFSMAWSRPRHDQLLNRCSGMEQVVQAQGWLVLAGIFSLKVPTVVWRIVSRRYSIAPQVLGISESDLGYGISACLSMKPQTGIGPSVAPVCTILERQICDEIRARRAPSQPAASHSFQARERASRRLPGCYPADGRLACYRTACSECCRSR